MSLNDSPWIRCDRCIISLSQMQLYLTLCGHIFCLSCLGLGEKKDQADCPTCNSNTHLLEINSTLGQNKAVYFKDPEEESKEVKKKVEKTKSFQRYHFENNVKIMYIKFRRATEATKASEKMKEELKRREQRLLAVIKEKDTIIKEKESEIGNLKDKVTQLNRLASRIKEDERALKGRVQQLEIYTEMSKEKVISAKAKLDLINLKRRGETKNKISYQNPDHATMI
uniref:RING-type domain-containing protein n=1 Tax=Strongyloides papillosus TaxID=174720 RepID=A0A0N5B7M8_STREA